MNKISKIIVLFVLMQLTSCTTKQTNFSTDKNEYQVYLKDSENIKLKNINADINFWQAKFDKDPNQDTYLSQLASLYSQRFEISGTISDLYHSEKLLLETDIKRIGENAGTKRAIAKNYISQHRFKEALTYLNEALILGENKVGTQNMLFDVHMELGNYKEAKNILNSLTNYNDFDFVIRMAKYQDYVGQLPKTIELMKKAKSIAEKSKNESMQLWVYTNLGDFYGHNNQIEESYKYFLKALKLDNHNYYALKGIAWIAFSHERNTEKAQEIVDFILTKHEVPDLYLLQSEIAEFKSDKKTSEWALNQYNKLLSEYNYGEMYNTYNFDLWVEDKKSIDKALSIAEREIKNRPTPESYDLLAWSFFKKGEPKKALEIAKKHTINKSFEPTINYHICEILKANDKPIQEEVKSDLLSSIYELGPSFETNIKNL